jgi:anti-anti-sigma factor
MRDCKTEGALLQIEAVGRPQGAAVLRCAGEIDFSNLHLLEQALVVAIAEGAPALEVDLSAVDYMDSSTLLTLLRTHRELAAEGRALCVRANPWGLRLFRLLRLDQLLDVRPA